MDTYAYNEEKKKRDYITEASKNIDMCIKHGDFKGAFNLFLLTVARLDNIERQEFIDYYNLKIIN